MEHYENASITYTVAIIRSRDFLPKNVVELKFWTVHLSVE